jgi:DNA-binding MarR family transcriptional regulator
MATIDRATRKFAQDAIEVERVLRESRIRGNAARVVFLLNMAQKGSGVTQKDVVNAMALPKDVVSKLVGSLVQAGLLKQKRTGVDSRIKLLTTAGPGRALLSRVKAALQKTRPRKQEPGQTSKRLPLLDGYP